MPPPASRERVGMLAFDALLNQVGAFIASHVDARRSDHALRRHQFAAAVSARRRCGAQAPGRRVCAIASTREMFDHDGKTLTLGLSFGICSFCRASGRSRRDAQRRRTRDGRRAHVWPAAMSACIKLLPATARRTRSTGACRADPRRAQGRQFPAAVSADRRAAGCRCRTVPGVAAPCVAATASCIRRRKSCRSRSATA